jgi:GNAT superfamily N-acetyltransferase
MSTDGVVRIEPLTPARWDDAVAVFGTRGDPASCWCQWFRLTGQDWRQSTAATNRQALREQCESARAAGTPEPGLLAYVGDQPAGWVAVAPREAYPRLGRHRALVAVLEAAGPTAASADGAGDVAEDVADDAVWSVSCFVVRVGFRRRGVSAALLEAAVAFAARHGATAVEGYPVEVVPGERRPASELYHGTRTTFVDAGFTEVGRSAPHRPVMRRALG